MKKKVFDLSGTKQAVSETTISKQVLKLMEKGFRPDSKGYLSRGDTYVINESGNFRVEKYSNIWNSDGNVLIACDVVNVID